MSVVAPGRLPAGRAVEVGGAVTALAADHGAETVVAATEHGDLWRLAAGAGIEALPTRHDHAVVALATDPPSGRVASGDRRGTVLIQHPEDDPVHLAMGSRVRSLAWSPTGELLAVVSQAGGVVVVDPNGSRIAGLPPSRRFRSVAWHRSDGETHLVAVGAGGTTWIDPDRSDPVARRDRADGAGLVVAVDASGTWVAVGDLRGQVRILDTTAGHETEISGWPDPVDRLAWMPQRGTLAVVGGDEVTLWGHDHGPDADSAQVQEPPRCDVGDRRISAIAPHPFQQRLAIGGTEGEMVVWDVDRASVLRARALPDLITCLAWDRTGRALIAGSRCGRIEEVELVDRP